MRIAQGELVEFPTPLGDVLHGFLARPKGRTTTCIIHVHGMTGNFYRSDLTAALREAATAAGLAFFAINTQGHDMVATTKRHGRRGLAGTAMERFEECVPDLKAAIAAARKLGFTRTILSGHSTGCQKVAFYQQKTKDPKVKGIVLLAPADDYNSNKETMPGWGAAVRTAKRIAKRNAPEMPDPKLKWFSARRFLSVSDLRQAEARMFDYEGPLREFSRITTPILVVFGSEEEYAVKDPEEYLAILARKTRSTRFLSVLIRGGDHSFKGKEQATASVVAAWAGNV